MTCSMKESARLSLASASYDPKKLALIHTGVVIAASLVAMLVSFVLDMGMGSTGGLSGIGSRAVLASAQSMLNMAMTVLLPFWEIGFLFAALRLARQEEVDVDSLKEGFRRFWPVFRLFLLQALLMSGVVMACSYAASSIIMMTPYAHKIYEAAEPLLSESGELVMNEATIMKLLPAMVPMYVVLVILLLAFGLPMFYRYRMAQMAMMDNTPGALKAMGISTLIMRGHRFALFKVDLSFWWYYALQLLIAAMAYGSDILTVAGVSLPVSSTMAYWLFNGLCFALRLLVAWKFTAYVQTTYAHCYDTFRKYAVPVNFNRPQQEM